MILLPEILYDDYKKSFSNGARITVDTKDGKQYLAYVNYCGASKVPIAIIQKRNEESNDIYLCPLKGSKLPKTFGIGQGLKNEVISYIGELCKKTIEKESKVAPSKLNKSIEKIIANN